MRTTLLTQLVMDQAHSTQPLIYSSRFSLCERSLHMLQIEELRIQASISRIFPTRKQVRNQSIDMSLASRCTLK